MAVEKNKPLKVVDSPEDEVEIEVEEETPETEFDANNTVLLEDGGAIVNYEEESGMGDTDDFYENLAENIDEAQLSEMAADLIEAYKEDTESRQEWLDSYTEGLDLLGTSTDERSEPFRGASGVYHPLLVKRRKKSKSKPKE